MTSTDENVKILSRAVLGEARNAAEKILADARTKADEIRQKGLEQSSVERAKIIDRAALEAERVRSQAIAITQLKARTMELEQREKLLVNAFETARQQLPDVQGTAGYEEIAQQLLREALMQLGSPSVKVLSDEKTQKAFTSNTLEKISSEMKIKIRLGDTLKKGIGVIVETEDGRRQYDNTLETRLKRMQDTLRTPVYHILMGEPL